VAEHSISFADGDRIEFRIGINADDVVVEDGDILGNGVNVAARLLLIARLRAPPMPA
jgi:adenylate cyclase